MYPRVPWELVADPSGSAGHTLQPTELYHQQHSSNDGRLRPKQNYQWPSEQCVNAGVVTGPRIPT